MAYQIQRKGIMKDHKGDYGTDIKVRRKLEIRLWHPRSLVYKKKSVTMIE